MPQRSGAHARNRTADRLLTMQVLCRLSYVGLKTQGSRLLPPADSGVKPKQQPLRFLCGFGIAAPGEGDTHYSSMFPSV